MTVERPLRLNFEATEERIARLDDQSAFVGLAVSKKRKDAKAVEAEEAEGRGSRMRSAPAGEAGAQRALHGPPSF